VISIDKYRVLTVYEKLCEKNKDLWRYGDTQFRNRCNELAKALGVDKQTAKKLIQKLPFGTKKYIQTKNVTIAEISAESGVYGINLFRMNLKNERIVKVVSPFMRLSDIENLRRFLEKNAELRVITDTNSFESIRIDSVDGIFLPEYTSVGGLDTHAKLLLTSKVAIIGSMNYYITGMKPNKSIELVVVFRDRNVVEDLHERFDWWWKRCDFLNHSTIAEQNPKITENFINPKRH